MFDSPIQFEEADQAIAKRLPAATALKYRDIMRQWAPEARQRAFFSARVMDATVLSELKRRTQQVVSGEMTSEQATRLMQEFFRGEGAPLLQRMGFLPQDQGQGKGVSELASTARLRLIFETNTRMAQEVGHYKQWEAVKEAYPYGVWHCGYAEEHRPEHLARDGKAYPFDHPIWTHSPPGGEFNCHCWREPISAEEARLRGLLPEPMDSAFKPSSLGFDPSRGMDQPVEAGKRTAPELAEKAKLPPSPEQLAPILPDHAADPAPAPQSQPTAPPVPKVAIGGGGTLDVGRMEEGNKHGQLVTGEEIDRKTRELSAKIMAENQLSSIPGVQQVDFDGWEDDDGIRAVAAQMESLADEYDVPPPFSRFTVQPIISLKTGEVSDSIGGICLRGNNVNGIDKQVSLNIKVLEQIPKWRSELDTDVDDRYMGLAAFIRKGKEAECMATHEFGHRIISRFIERGEAQEIADYINLVYKRHIQGWHTSYGFVGVSNEISAYAASNWEEFWSECFSIYKCGDKERLPKDIRAMVGNVLSCITKENPHDVAEIKKVTQLFRKEYKTLDKIHATIDEFGQSHAIIDGGGREIAHNEIPRIEGVLPDLPREKAEDHPEKIHDGISNVSEAVKEEQREKCRRDIEELQPGLADEAQRVYDQMDETEKDVIHAYTMRDIYNINTDMYRMYKAEDRQPEQRHKLSDFLDERQRTETERRLRVLEKLPKFVGTVYRGMDLKKVEEVDDFKEKWRNGYSPLTGFVSTTYVRGNEKLYVENPETSVILIIHNSKNGSYIGHLSSTPADEEVLFGCNQKFQLMTEQELGHEPIERQGNVTYINIKEK